jgi:putative acyl-CoA dehydrogenase
LLNVRNSDGELNNITIHRLKNKLGTKAVPTAELELQGTTAILIGEPGQGVKKISSVLNITRIYCATGCLSAMRKGIAIARDYADRRSVFGKKLSSQPLHLSTLADMEIEFRGCLKFFIDILHLFGLVETGKASQKQNILFRFLCPIIKLYTSKSSSSLILEVMESLGGTGYMEDSGVPVIVRNVFVNMIWEGTTNVLSLDVWRAIMKENALSVFLEIIKERTDKIKGYTQEKQNIYSTISLIEKYVLKVNIQDQIESTARNFSFSLARLYIGLLLLEHAEWTNELQDIIASKRWFTDREIWQIPSFDTINDRIKENEILAMNSDPQGNYRGVGNTDKYGKIRPKI